MTADPHTPADHATADRAAEDRAPAARAPAGHAPGGRSRPVARRPDLDSLYCVNPDGSRNEIHPADVTGRFQRRKKLVWSVLILIWIVLPWIEVGGRPAILIDIERRSFFLFGATFNAQDFWLAFFLVSGIGFLLFVVSALFGRVWCGWSCPHTVFLEGVFRRVERWIEGGAAARKRLAEMPWSTAKVARRAAKLAVFLAISLFLAHNLLSYFFGAHDVVAAVTRSPAEHPTAFVFVVLTTLLVFANFTWFREQLCIVVCPYGRLQGVLYDRDTINVAYDDTRGEPRGRYTESGRGDCIDCFRCVAVCPTGIDIRNGTQLECVGCANCVDACDEVMDKVGQPRGLVRYDSERGFEEGRRRLLRPRLWFYAVLLLIGVGVFALTASGRTPFEAKLSRQQGASYAVDGPTLTNALSLHFVNKSAAPMTFTIAPVEVEQLTWTVPLREVTLPSFGDQRVPLFARLPRSAFVRGRQAEVGVTAGGVQTTLTIELLGPETR